MQLPGATSQSPLGSPSVVRKEEDYDDFWAENGVGAGNKGTTASGSSGQGNVGAGNAGGAPAGSAKSKGASGKDDEWENW